MTVCHACGQSIDAKYEARSTSCKNCGHVRAVHVCKYIHHIEGEKFGTFCNCESFQAIKKYESS